MKINIIAAVILCLSSTLFPSFEVLATEVEKELQIIRITPAGEDIEAGRQIVIEFNRSVVPLGKMDRSKQEIPVTITPEVNCEWRWLNTTTLACNLNENDALKQSTKYQLVVNPGIMTEDGATISRAFKHEFITSRAEVKYTWFKTWESPGSPVIRVTLNQPVTKDSLEKHLFFAESRKKDSRIKVKANLDPDDYEKPYIIPASTTEKLLSLSNQSALVRSDDQVTIKSEVEARRIWLVRPVKEFVLDSKITLKLEPGLVSVLGSENSIVARDIVEFNTFPEFNFAGIKCYTNEGKEVLITHNNPQTASNLCNPLSSISLMFSTPVFRSEVKKNFKFTPSLSGKLKNYDPWGSLDQEYSKLEYPYTKGNLYEVWLPGGLKAAQEYVITLRPRKLSFYQKMKYKLLSYFKTYPRTNLKDEFGKKLEKPFRIKFTTDHRKPNFELPYRNAVLEKQVDSEVPLYVNNLNKYKFNYRSITSDGVKENASYEAAVPYVQDIQFAVPFGVRKILNGKSGAVFGFLETDPVIVTKGSWESKLFAQVTPYQMQVKLGHFNTLVWVTDLATGNAVDHAKVTIYKNSFLNLSVPQEILAIAETDEKGIAILPGTETLDPALYLGSRWDDKDNMLFIRVDKEHDMAIMPLTYDFTIDTWRVSSENIYSYHRKKYAHLLAWGTTAQGIYRAGDTIQYKLYIRNQDINTLALPPKSGYKLEVLDPTGKVVHEVKDFVLSDFGAISGEVTTPKQAITGWYDFRLTLSYDYEINSSPEEAKNSITLYPMKVLVSDFTPSPFKVTNEINGELFVAEQEVIVHTAAKLHSGGAYTDASSRVTALLESKKFTSFNPLAQNFYFASVVAQDIKQQIYQKQEKLNEKGELQSRFVIPKQDIIYGKIIIESAVQDDRGKYITAHSNADYLGVDRLVGMRATKWLYEKGKVDSVEYIVVDEHGKPISGSKVNIIIDREVTNAAKVKGAGNTYITNFTTDWKQESTCNGISSSSAASECKFTPSQAGTYRITANIKDTKGNLHSTEIKVWAVGGDYVLWSDNSDYYLPIIPEKSEYRVGEEAQFLIKNPYPGANALVTIERYGVIEHFIQKLEGSTPVIKLPIKADYLPGFYLSVTVFSPRVDKPQKDWQIDLGKPTFKMGYTTVHIKDKYKEMVVIASTDKEVYKPREKVKLKLHAEPKFIGDKEPIEFAVVVLDEAVLDLIAGGKLYYDPYNGFYKLEDLDLRNYSLLTTLLGRQKFEKKGANPGGDGGSDFMLRNIFKFVSYWNPSILADDNGNGEVEFEVPDNLTGWRVMTIAMTPKDKMGLGDISFKVNRPTEVRPVMPNQIVEKDNFLAGFSIMNRTDKKRTLNIDIKANGDIELIKMPKDLVQTVELEPYKHKVIWQPIQTKVVKAARDKDQGEVNFIVKVWDDIDSDALTHTIPINKMRSLETAVNYATTTSKQVEESIAFPEKIHTDIGSVGITVAPSILNNLEGGFRYMHDYKYSCWEQILTKGVMASHYQNLKGYLTNGFVWKGSEKIAQETINLAASFQAPNGGMAYFMPEDSYVDPYLSAYTAIAFNWLKVSGYEIPKSVEEKLHGYLLDILKRDVVPDFYNEGMTSTVRAVALAALAEHGKTNLSDIERYLPHTKNMSLFGKALFMKAALKTKGAEKEVIEINKQILPHSNQSAGKFIFSEKLDDSYNRILSSALRDNCAILDSFVDMNNLSKAEDSLGDIPIKMVRYITESRKNRDYWENTQENMFCMNALINYTRVYEANKPKYKIKTSFNEEILGEVVFKDLKDQPVYFERNISDKDLGTKAKLKIEKTGEGRVYYTTKVTYAPLEKDAKSINSGIEIKREYSVEKEGQWILLKNPNSIKRGEIVRVDIYLSLPTARNFVVVDDPVPGGLEPVNRDLANTSIVDANKGEFVAAGGSWWFKFSDWREYNASRWSFYHQELKHDAVKFYSDFLPAGNYHLSYVAQAIAEGDFAIMPPLAQEMYDPDIYGKGIQEHLKVKD